MFAVSAGLTVGFIILFFPLALILAYAVEDRTRTIA